MEKYVKMDFNPVTKQRVVPKGPVEFRGNLADVMYMYHDTQVSYYQEEDLGAYMQNNVFNSIARKIKDPAHQLSFISAMVEDLGEIGMDEGILTNI